MTYALEWWTGSRWEVVGAHVITLADRWRQRDPVGVFFGRQLLQVSAHRCRATPKPGGIRQRQTAVVVQARMVRPRP